MNNDLANQALKADTEFVYGLGLEAKELNKAVIDLANTDIPILLLGESGTGKDAYARLIHRLSGLHEDSLKKVACTRSDTEVLIEEIRSALTSAQPATLFLDGIDELEPAYQRMLISLLPDNEVRANRRTVRTRLVSSSSENLEQQVVKGQFRRELYFRINAAPLRIPPLRERKEDIPSLFDCLLARHSKELQRTAPLVDSQALDFLVSYHWPGNIRELENVARKIVALGNVDAVLTDLRRPICPPHLRSEKAPSSLKHASRAASHKTEREMILKALTHTHWNRKRAACELQISYKSLLYKIKELVVQETDT